MKKLLVIIVLTSTPQIFAAGVQVVNAPQATPTPQVAPAAQAAPEEQKPAHIIPPSEEIKHIIPFSTEYIQQFSQEKFEEIKIAQDKFAQVDQAAEEVTLDFMREKFGIDNLTGIGDVLSYFKALKQDALVNNFEEQMKVIKEEILKISKYTGGIDYAKIKSYVAAGLNQFLTTQVTPAIKKAQKNR